MQTGYMMKCTLNAPLEQAKKAFSSVGMYFTVNILPMRMLDYAVTVKLFVKSLVRFEVIGHYIRFSCQRFLGYSP